MVIAGIASALMIGSLMLAPSDRIEEDSPLWNCQTMGNHICGPVSK